MFPSSQRLELHVAEVLHTSRVPRGLRETLLTRGPARKLNQ
jgi:hypothetical protein